MSWQKPSPPSANAKAWNRRWRWRSLQSVPQGDGFYRAVFVLGKYPADNRRVGIAQGLEFSDTGFRHGCGDARQQSTGGLRIKDQGVTGVVHPASLIPDTPAQPYVGGLQRAQDASRYGFFSTGQNRYRSQIQFGIDT